MMKVALILLSYDDCDYFGSHQQIFTDTSAISRLHLHNRVSWMMTNRVTQSISTFPQKLGVERRWSLVVYWKREALEF